MFRRSDRASQRAVDPREFVDYFYQRQLEELTQIRRSVNDLSTDRKRIELQLNTLKQQTERIEHQANLAAEAGRQDLAEEARARIPTVNRNLQNTNKHYSLAIRHEERATHESAIEQALVESFRTFKEIFKAEYGAAIESRRSLPSASAYSSKPSGEELTNDEVVKSGMITDLINPDFESMNTTADDIKE